MSGTDGSVCKYLITPKYWRNWNFDTMTKWEVEGSDHQMYPLGIMNISTKLCARPTRPFFCQHDLKSNKTYHIQAKKRFMVSELHKACMSLHSPLSSLTPIQAWLKQIKLQHKVDTEENLFYDHPPSSTCAYVRCAQSQTIWQVNSAASGTGLFLSFLWLSSPLSSKPG